MQRRSKSSRSNKSNTRRKGSNRNPRRRSERDEERREDESRERRASYAESDERRRGGGWPNGERERSSRRGWDSDWESSRGERPREPYYFERSRRQNDWEPEDRWSRQDLGGRRSRHIQEEPFDEHPYHGRYANGHARYEDDEDEDWIEDRRVTEKRQATRKRAGGRSPSRDSYSGTSRTSGRRSPNARTSKSSRGRSRSDGDGSARA